MLRSRPYFPAALALSMTALGSSLAFAEVYHSVEVRGARHIPKDDIVETCGPLTGVELDRVDLTSVEECLFYTGVFDKVTVKGQGNRLMIEVVETETKPGRIEVGAAYFSDVGLTGTLDYRQFNLIPETYLSIKNSYHPENKSYDISVLRQEIGPQKLHFGIDLAGQRTAFDDRNYESRVDQFEIFLGKVHENGLRGDFGIGYRDQRLGGIKAGASAQLRKEVGSVHAPFAHASLSYQQADEEETSSLNAYFDGYLWNIGTSSELLDLRVEVTGHYQINESLDLHLGLSAGTVAGRDDNHPRLVDRAFLGGDSLRGFAPRGIGPISGEDRLGGDHYAKISAELRHDLGKLGDEVVKGGIFLDAGSVWSVKNATAGSLDDAAHLRASLGLSLNMTLGSVPLQAYVAKAITRETGDETQVFGLNILTQF